MISKSLPISLLMLKDFQSAVKIRAVIVFILVHAGLMIALSGLLKQQYALGWDSASTLLAIGVGLLYGGFALGVFMIVAPIWPWVRRARRMEELTAWVIRDLPVLLEQLPKVIAAVKAVGAAWNEVTHQSETPKPSDPVSKG
jgi:hypothetical protein